MARDPEQHIQTVISQLGRGTVQQDLHNALREAAQATVETGKAATVTLKIRFSPVAKVAGSLTSSAIVKKTLPEAEAVNNIWFLDEDGDLVRNPPNQATFWLPKVVAEDQGTTASGERFDPKTGEIAQ